MDKIIQITITTIISCITSGLIFVTYPAMQNYAVAKDTFESSISLINARLDRIENKQDIIIDKLK